LVKTSTRAEIDDAIKLSTSVQRNRLNDALLRLRTQKRVKRAYDIKLHDVEIVAVQLGLKIVEGLTCEQFFEHLVKTYPEKDILRR